MNQRIYEAFNDQMNFEIYSAHIYLNMAACAGDLGLDGIKNWFLVQYEEELFHAKYFMNIMLENGFRPVVLNWEENPTNDFNSALELFETGLHHEKIVTSRIHNLMRLAREENDYAVEHVVSWFVKEQVEEESNFNGIIAKLKLVKDAGVYLLDQELGARVFVAPNIA